MGSFLKPKAVPLPQSPRPAPSVTAPVIPSEPTQTDSEIQAEAREQSLLRRNRGRLGTITTSFSGFLSPKENNSNRKTLLGE